MVSRCGKCKAAFVVNKADFGPKGRRVRCSVAGCDNEWFQSTSRLSPVPPNLELVEYPEKMAERVRAGLSAVPEDMVRVFVGNLPYQADEEDLRELFADYGVSSINMPTDEQGRRKGFGFVGFETEESGKEALAALNGVEFKGRELAISEAKGGRR
jgi:predicted Zn finger-like uncharacterized protein